MLNVRFTKTILRRVRNCWLPKVYNEHPESGHVATRASSPPDVLCVAGTCFCTISIGDSETCAEHLLSHKTISVKPFCPDISISGHPRRRSFFGLARISSGRFCLLAEYGRVCLMTKPVSVHSGTNLSSRHFLPSMMQEFATMTRTHERLALYFHIFIYIFSWQLACI